MISFTGSMVAIVTPFKNGKFDEVAFRDLIDWQIKSGTDVIVPCGTTGEATTVSDAEKDRIIRVAVEQAGGRVPVLAGAGSNSTDAAINTSKLAKSAGADGLLHVTPYYNKPTQEGLFQHFRAISEIVDIPVVLYNVPSRTGVNMSAETTIRLASRENIVAIKEASGDLKQIETIVKYTSDDFAVISGEDAQNLEIYKLGGKGCISVTANVLPDQVAKVWDLFQAGDENEASKIQEGLAAMNDAMFIETNPIPVKTALATMGKIREEFRLPLTPMSEDNSDALKKTLNKYDLI